MAQEEISSDLKSLQELIINSSEVFYIPDYQRNFVWGKKEISDLFMDFKEDTDDFTKETSELEGYLLGDIVLIDSKEGKQVIDGQQRLTTLSILFRVLYDEGLKKVQEFSNVEERKKAETWMGLTSELKKGFEITTDDDEFKSLKIQHDSWLKFGDYYRLLIRDQVSDNVKVETTSEINIKKVYDAIQDQIKELDDNEIRRLIIYLKTKVKLIVTIAPNPSKAFQLFEVLNKRGKDLEPMDLIKNKFLKILQNTGHSDGEMDSFKDSWGAFVENLQISSKKQISSSVFVRHYLMAFNGVNVKRKELFRYFNDSENGFNEPSKIVELCKNLKKYSDNYSKIEKGDYSVFNNSDNIYTLFEVLSLTQMHPLLMLIYDADDSIKERVLDSIVRFGAAVIFSYQQTNYIEKNIPAIATKFLQEKDESKKYEILISELESLIKERAALAEAVLATKDFSDNNGKPQSKVMYLLEFLELYCCHVPDVRNQAKDKSLTIEHILSRNLEISDYNELGVENKEEMNEYLNRLGNLTLLYGPENSSIGNKKFEDKLPMYKQSVFRATHNIVEPSKTEIKNGKDTQLVKNINSVFHSYEPNAYGQFDKKLINQRSSDLAKAMYHILINDYPDADVGTIEKPDFFDE